jgi:hypothetical protein
MDESVFHHISNLHDGMSQENSLVARVALKRARTKASARTTQWAMQITSTFNNSYLFFFLFLFVTTSILWHIRSKQELWTHNSRPLLGSRP